MPLQTTVIGAYPKPDYLQMPDWFRYRRNDYTTTGYAYDVATANTYKASQNQEAAESELQQALTETVEEQIGLGIDVITDGEIGRENYIYHFCRHLDGFDFDNPVSKTGRQGAVKWTCPQITGAVRSTGAATWCVNEWKQAQAISSVPVKYTIPGPMTIADTTVNVYYKDHVQLLEDLAVCVNQYVCSLAAAGCKYIQVDEPVLMRKPDDALDIGIHILSKCFKGVGSDVEKAIHLCCGYPIELDNTDYPKADKNNYQRLAQRLDNAGFDAVSIEDAHCHNDLSLLKSFTKTKVILGSVRVAESRVETMEEVRGRLQEALHYIPADRLLVAPDCGLGFLPKDVLKQKLTNMVAAAKSLP